MKISLYNTDLQRIAIIDEKFVSCLWSEGYNTIEPFSLELRATEEYKKKVRPDYFIGRNDRKTLMVIKSVEVSGDKIVATGSQASILLDDVAFVGTLPAGFEVDTEIAKVYNESSKLEKVEFVSSGITDTYDHQIGNKSFRELCETVCKSKDIGLRSIRNGQSINIQFYKIGAKPNLVFSQKFGNLNIDTIKFSTKVFKNYAIVLGEGEGESRVRVDVDLTNGETRRELIVDARDVQRQENETASSYKTRLRARGIEKLLENQKIFDLIFTPFEKDFGKKYDLGDILTIFLPELDMKIQSRIVRFTEKSQNNQTTINIDVGNLVIKR